MFVACIWNPWSIRLSFSLKLWKSFSMGDTAYPTLYLTSHLTDIAGESTRPNMSSFKRICIAGASGGRRSVQNETRRAEH
jgi:hypothetical protein